MGLVGSDNCLTSPDFAHVDSLPICVIIESTYSFFPCLYFSGATYALTW